MAATRRTHLILFLIFFALTATAPLFACPMCSDLMDRGADAMKSWRFGRGIGWSIFVMLGILFSMIGAFVWTILRAQKRNTSSPNGFVGDRQAHGFPPKTMRE